ncbi:hypothetical protein [Xanthomonas campestris]|nr:hypothetical protein [Xanthomonas campestris]
MRWLLQALVKSTKPARADAFADFGRLLSCRALARSAQWPN